MSVLGAVFAIHAGSYSEMTRDVSGMTLDQIAEVVEQEIDVDVSLCHECGGKVSDPTPVELVAFTVDGVEYSQDDDGNWVKS